MLITQIKKALDAMKSRAPSRRRSYHKSKDTRHTRNSDATKSVMIFGHADSSLPLTFLEALKKAVEGREAHVTGLIVGSGFDRVERALTSIGFDATHRLCAINSPRTLLRFESSTDSGSWHLSSSEIVRTGGFPGEMSRLTPGKSYRIDASLNFSDWTETSSGRMKHLYKETIAARPVELIFKESVYIHDGKGYDGVSGVETGDELILRLRQFGELGLNAATFIKGLFHLAQAAELKINTATLHSLVTDEARRADLLRRMAPWIGSNPPFKIKEGGVRSSFKNVRDFHTCVPPMAYHLVRSLYMECHMDLDILEPEDLLMPGRIFHIATQGRCAEYTAFCMKRDLQQLALARPADPTLVVIATESAELLCDAELDMKCLSARNIFQCFAVTSPEKLKRMYGDSMDTIITDFPRLFWHTGRSRGLRDLFGRLHSASDGARERIMDLSLENRLEESGGAIIETAVDLDADGMESSERVRLDQMNRRNRRVEFLPD